MRKKVVIIGAGFAGMSALKKLAPHGGKTIDLTFIDRRRAHHFLPLLPDMIGKRMPKESLQYSYTGVARHTYADFVCDTVETISPGDSRISTASGVIEYDYLILSPGSVTNFYGNSFARSGAHTFDDVTAVERIRNGLETFSGNYFVIVGGGYTGIELATNLWAYFRKKGQKKKIIIIEKRDSLLGPLPQWMKEYVKDNLKKMDIEVSYESEVADFQGQSVRLSDGRTFFPAMLFWVAGVRIPSFCSALTEEKLPQARLKVDRYLRLQRQETIFVAGDAAYFEDNGNPLRMAVNIARTQGVCAANNVLRSILRKPLIPYRPQDLGFVVPLGNNRACGSALGVTVKGRVAIGLHYFFCILRSYGIRNRWNILGALIKGGYR